MQIKLKKKLTGPEFMSERADVFQCKYHMYKYTHRKYPGGRAAGSPEVTATWEAAIVSD